MNLPLTIIVIIICGAFIDLKVPEGTIREKLGRIDWCVVHTALSLGRILTCPLMIHTGSGTRSLSQLSRKLIGSILNWSIVQSDRDTFA